MVDFLSGRLRVGEAMSPPLMRAVKARLEALSGPRRRRHHRRAAGRELSGCQRGDRTADVILLVTEPTPFGVYDFQLAQRPLRPWGNPWGLVVNRAGLGNDEIYQSAGQTRSCRSWPKSLTTGPIAEAYAQGRIIAETSRRDPETFASLPKRSATWPAGRRREAAK